MTPVHPGLLRLLHLVSPALPIGAFNFSQGLEYAVECGWIKDLDSAQHWIGGIAANAIGTLDLPIVLRLHQAWSNHDANAVLHWSQHLIAARETLEIRNEDRHLGRALAKVLIELGLPEAQAWTQHPAATYATSFTLAATHWQIDAPTAATGYLWAWMENQVLAAIKLIPLGQSAGQRLLNALMAEIPLIVEQALAIKDEEIGSACPSQGIASGLHETQYSRLFRS